MYNMEFSYSYKFTTPEFQKLCTNILEKFNNDKTISQTIISQLFQDYTKDLTLSKILGKEKNNK